MAMSWLAEKLREVTGTKDHAFQRYRRRSEREDSPAATTVTVNLEPHERVRVGRARPDRGESDEGLANVVGSTRSDNSAWAGGRRSRVTSPPSACWTGTSG